MRLELQPMRAVVQPNPGGRDPLARRNHRGVANRCHQIPVPPRFNAQHAKADLRIVEGYPFHQAGQNLRTRLLALLHIAVRRLSNCGNFVAIL